jgi:hypothetical protein
MQGGFMKVRNEATEFTCPVCGRKGLDRIVLDVKPNPFLDVKPYSRSILYACRGANGCGAELHVIGRSPEKAENRIYDTVTLMDKKHSHLPEGEASYLSAYEGSKQGTTMEYFRLSTNFKVNEAKL